MKTTRLRPAARSRRGTFRAIATVIAAVFIVGLAPASAMAAEAPAVSVSAQVAPVGASAVPVSVIIPKTGPEEPGSELCPSCKNYKAQGAKSKLIPLNRWAHTSTELHNRPNNLDPLGTAVSAARMASQQGLLGAIESIWTATAFLTDFSANLTPVNLLGNEIDQATGKLGTALFNNPLIFTLTGIGLLIGAIWNKSRGRDSTRLLKRALGVVLVLVAIGMMSLGATKSKMVGDSFRPGVGSPGWIVTEISTVIGAATDAALGGFTSTTFATNPEEGKITTTMSCTKYVANIKDLYKANQGPNNGASISAMSGMWETVGLRAWVNTQFGADNKYADKVWCHQADGYAHVGVTKQLDLTVMGVSGGVKLRELYNSNRKRNADNTGWETGSKAFRTYNNVDEDRTGIAWAACQWDGDKFYVEPAFTKPIRGKGEPPTWICQKTAWPGGMVPKTT